MALLVYTSIDAELQYYLTTY